MKDREKIVEAMARTYCIEEGVIPDGDVTNGLGDFIAKSYQLRLGPISAALTTLEAELSARGLAILPVEATEEMAREGAAHIRSFMSDDGPYPRTKTVYRATPRAERGRR